MTNTVFNEPILEDDYPVFVFYWYVMDGEARRSYIQGTVRDLRRSENLQVVRRCDAVARELPLF